MFLEGKNPELAFCVDRSGCTPLHLVSQMYKFPDIIQILTDHMKKHDPDFEKKFWSKFKIESGSGFHEEQLERAREERDFGRGVIEGDCWENFERKSEKRDRFDRPTLAHRFISLLHQKGILLRNYTQNIDMLEYQACVPREENYLCARSTILNLNNYIFLNQTSGTCHVAPW